MKATFASLALFLAGVLAQSPLTINTPANVVECEPTLISWTGGTAPYYLSITPGATPNGAAVESFPATNATSLTWIVNISQNTYIDLNLRDGAGTVAQSAPFTINAGTSTTCTNVTSVAPGPTSSAGANSPTTAGAGTTAGTTPTTTASTGATSSPAAKSAASANIAQVGAAGVAAAAVAALFL